MALWKGNPSIIDHQWWVVDAVGKLCCRCPLDGTLCHSSSPSTTSLLDRMAKQLVTKLLTTCFTCASFRMPNFCCWQHMCLCILAKFYHQWTWSFASGYMLASKRHFVFICEIQHEIKKRLKIQTCPDPLHWIDTQRYLKVLVQGRGWCRVGTSRCEKVKSFWQQHQLMQM